MEMIQNLNWRYATKKFDTAKPVSESDIEKIMEAVRLSASSYGLQPYKIMVVKDPEVKAKLRPAAWNQPQVTDASHLFIFCHFDDVTEEYIDEYINLISEVRDMPKDMLKQFSDVMKGSMLGLSTDAKANWSSRQTYIAIGTLLAACAELRVDSCPMEGFENDKFDEILGLKEKGLRSIAMAAIGYRSEEDPTRKWAKVRKSKEDLYEII